jgi:hypothetical protein
VAQWLRLLKKKCVPLKLAAIDFNWLVTFVSHNPYKFSQNCHKPGIYSSNQKGLNL